MQTMGAAKYGMQSLTAPALPFAPATSGVANGAVTTGATQRFFDPENPELWLVGIGALTLGLIAVSTSVRVGPLSFSAAAGK